MEDQRFKAIVGADTEADVRKAFDARGPSIVASQGDAIEEPCVTREGDRIAFDLGRNVRMVSMHAPQAEAFARKMLKAAKKAQRGR